MKLIFAILSFVFVFHLGNLSASDPATLSTATPAPTEYVTDYTGILDSTIKATLDSQLKDYEAKTSNQIIVVIAKNVGNGELDSTCNAVFHKWGIGQKGKNNGVVLFWFTEMRKLRIEVGYGLEGALPDITAKRIIDDEITPCFKKQQWSQGLQQGVDGIIKATQGEYKNAGVVGDEPIGVGIKILIALCVLIVLVCILVAIFGSDSGDGFFSGFVAGSFSGGGGSDDSSSSDGGGDDSSSSDGGGGFSGGGGDSGGGGADGGY